MLLFSVISPRRIPYFFFNDTATTEIYTLSLHDALPIYVPAGLLDRGPGLPGGHLERRSEEHTSELQSRRDLVCRLLLEKKKNILKSYLYKKINKNYITNSYYQYVL